MKWRSTAFKFKDIAELTRAELEEAGIKTDFFTTGVVCSKRLLNHMIWKSLRTHNFTYRRKETKL